MWSGWYSNSCLMTHWQFHIHYTTNAILNFLFNPFLRPHHVIDHAFRESLKTKSYTFILSAQWDGFWDNFCNTFYWETSAATCEIRNLATRSDRRPFGLERIISSISPWSFSITTYIFIDRQHMYTCNNIHRVRKKKSLEYFRHNFIKWWPIFETLSLLQSAENLQ